MLDPSIGAQWQQGVLDMKEVQCSSSSCPQRRIHHERPQEPRGAQFFWVPSSHPGPWYCSIECSVYGAHERAVAEAENEGMVPKE